MSKCVSCSSHYVGTARNTFIDTTLAWRCPGKTLLLLPTSRPVSDPVRSGGDSPPENCLNSNFRMSPDGSQCACNPGMYASGPDCVPCEPGYMCPNGTRVQCPLHFYQPASGATSCLQCGSTGDDNGFFKCNKRGYLLQFCDPAVPSSQTGELIRRCVQCSRCRRAYAATTDPNLVGCYRDD